MMAGRSHALPERQLVASGHSERLSAKSPCPVAASEFGGWIPQIARALGAQARSAVARSEMRDGVGGIGSEVAGASCRRAIGTVSYTHLRAHETRHDLV